MLLPRARVPLRFMGKECRTEALVVVLVEVVRIVGREKIGPTGVRTRDSLNLVRARYRYATQPVVGGVINSNTNDLVERRD